MKLSERTIDIEKREEGAWVKDPPEWPGLELKVRGAGNRDWSRLQQKLESAVPRKRKVDGIFLDPEDRLRIQRILLRDTALLDWRGIEDDAGNPEPFTKEAANKYLTEPRYEPFVYAVMWAANTVAEQRQDEIEDDVKN
jgi:hypothetical protein